MTPHLTIKKLAFDEQTKTSLQLDSNCSYTFYVLCGNGLADNQRIDKDDAIRILGTKQLDMDFTGELFCVQTPAQPGYRPVSG